MHIIGKWAQKSYTIDDALSYLNPPPREHRASGLPHPGNGLRCCSTDATHGSHRQGLRHGVHPGRKNPRIFPTGKGKFPKPLFSDSPTRQKAISFENPIESWSLKKAVRILEFCLIPSPVAE